MIFKRFKMTKKCCLCHGIIKGFGHNAEPLKKGRCCTVCNDTKVIPARIRGYYNG